MAAIQNLKNVIKDAFQGGVLPGLLQFLSDIIKAIVNGAISPEELRENPEIIATIYAGLQLADRLLGDDEKSIGEITIDEAKEALAQLTTQHNIPAIGMNWAPDAPKIE